jgi:hypothetical protein
VFHARLLPAAAVVAALSAAVRGLGACRPGGEGVSGSWADLAAACGRDGGLGRLRAGSAMGWAREGGWTGGGVWRAGRAGHARGVSSNSSRTTSSSKTALGLVAESLIPAPWRCGVGSGYPRTVWSQRLHKLKTHSASLRGLGISASSAHMPRTYSSGWGRLPVPSRPRMVHWSYKICALINFRL